MANFSQPARALNHIACFRVLKQRVLQGSESLVVQVICPIPGKRWQLYEQGFHGVIIRKLRMERKSETVTPCQPILASRNTSSSPPSVMDRQVMTCCAGVDYSLRCFVVIEVRETRHETNTAQRHQDRAQIGAHVVGVDYGQETANAALRRRCVS